MEKIENATRRPSFGNAFGQGWDTMSKQFLTLLLTVIIVGLITAPLQIIRVNLNPEDFNWGYMPFKHLEMSSFHVFAIFYGIFGLLYGLLVVPVFQYGSNLMFVQAARGARPKFDTLIAGFRKNYLHIILANVLVAALVIMGLIVLIIPGIIIGCRLAFVSYLVLDKGLDPIEAVEESWRLTKGHGWKIFFMGFVSIFIIIFGLILIVVGILPAIMWVSSSFASLYEQVLNDSNGLAKEEVTVINQ